MDEAEVVLVSELRQWFYCPRVVWHARQLGSRRPLTGSMRVGIQEEEDQWRLERRRTFARFGIEAARRRFRFSLRSDALGLSGMLDLMLELGPVSFEEACESRSSGLGPQFVPVEWKASGKPIQKHQLLQLAAYAMMIEDATETPCPFGFFVALPSERVTRVEIEGGLRQGVFAVRDQILMGVREPDMPKPTPQRAKCGACEFLRFCNDVW